MICQACLRYRTGCLGLIASVRATTGDDGWLPCVWESTLLACLAWQGDAKRFASRTVVSLTRLRRVWSAKLAAPLTSLGRGSSHALLQGTSSDQYHPALLYHLLASDDVRPVEVATDLYYRWYGFCRQYPAAVLPQGEIAWHCRHATANWHSGCMALRPPSLQACNRQF